MFYWGPTLMLVRHSQSTKICGYTIRRKSWSFTGRSHTYRDSTKFSVSFVSSLTFADEILVNAADNYSRDKTMTQIKVTIDPQKNLIKVWNNGKGIPVVVHAKEKVYVPELVFGHLLTSSNYDDSIRKVTGGRNGFGAKLTNIFSKKFTITTADTKNKKKFT